MKYIPTSTGDICPNCYHPALECRRVDSRPAACSVHGTPGLRLWLDCGVDRETGEWRLRMPAGDEDPDEEGRVWIAQDVIDAIISAQNDQDQPNAGAQALPPNT